MHPDEFETRMRRLEYFHALRLLPGVWTVLRVDGRGFSRLTEERFEKPFDLRFHDLMVRTARALLEELHGVYAYTESDEISVLFRLEWDLFDRELEKLVSLSAALASATFTHASGALACFDSRAWLGVSEADVVDCFRWRQADPGRCALNGWGYWSLRNSGQGVAEATRALERASVAEKNELLFQAGVNFNEVPLWQRRGTGPYWETYQKEGYNPRSGQQVLATRRRVRLDEELPMKDDYSSYVSQLIASGCSSR